MESSDKDFGDLPLYLKGNTSMMYSEVNNAPAKLSRIFERNQNVPIERGLH